MNTTKNKVKSFCSVGVLGVLCSMALCVTTQGQVNAAQDNVYQIKEGSFEPTWESLQQYKCPEWFRDVKLGIFLHWGPCSVPEADAWYGRNMYVEGHRAYKHHVKTYGHPSKFGYKDIIPLWKAEKFDLGSSPGAHARACRIIKSFTGRSQLEINGPIFMT